MLEEFQALVALKTHETMTRAALALRVSQSAISKRIHNLEVRTEKRLIEKQGRLVKLTPEALVLLDKAYPLLLQLNDALQASEPKTPSQIVIGVSESILSSWGPSLLKPWLTQGLLKVHCHRSPVVQERVAAGVYDMGICAGPVPLSSTLLSWEWLKEEMMVCGYKGKVSSKSFLSTSLLTIETPSATWRSIEAGLKSRGINSVEHIESFASIVQLVRSNLAVGLIPKGVARKMEIPVKDMQSLRPKLYRPVQLIMKKSKRSFQQHEQFLQELLKIKDFGF